MSAPHGRRAARRSAPDSEGRLRFRALLPDAPDVPDAGAVALLEVLGRAQVQALPRIRRDEQGLAWIEVGEQARGSGGRGRRRAEPTTAPAVPDILRRQLEEAVLAVHSAGWVMGAEEAALVCRADGTPLITDLHGLHRSTDPQERAADLAWIDRVLADGDGTRLRPLEAPSTTPPSTTPPTEATLAEATPTEATRPSTAAIAPMHCAPPAPETDESETPPPDEEEFAPLRALGTSASQLVLEDVPADDDGSVVDSTAAPEHDAEPGAEPAQAPVPAPVAPVTRPRRAARGRPDGWEDVLEPTAHRVRPRGVGRPGEALGQGQKAKETSNEASVSRGALRFRGTARAGRLGMLARCAAACRRMDVLVGAVLIVATLAAAVILVGRPASDLQPRDARSGEPSSVQAAGASASEQTSGDAAGSSAPGTLAGSAPTSAPAESAAGDAHAVTADSGEPAHQRLAEQLLAERRDYLTGQSDTAVAVPGSPAAVHDDALREQMARNSVEQWPVTVHSARLVDLGSGNAELTVRATEGDIVLRRPDGTQARSPGAGEVQWVLRLERGEERWQIVSVRASTR